MNEIIRKIEAEQLKENAPEFHVGDTVKVYAKIKEGNRERIQVFEGTVLKRQGGGARETFTVRKTSNGIGVEKTWPVHSPHVERVEVTMRGTITELVYCPFSYSLREQRAKVRACTRPW